MDDIPIISSLAGHRQQAGPTQRESAERVGASRQTLSTIDPT